MKKIYEKFCLIEETLCNIGFIGMVVLVFCSAIARSIGHPLAWSIDIAQLLLCWTTLIGADVAFRNGRFFGLDLIVKHFPNRVQKIIKILIDLIILITLIIFIYWGIKLSLDNWKRSFQTLKLSYSYVTLALPVMSCLMSISVVLDIKKLIKAMR